MSASSKVASFRLALSKVLPALQGMQSRQSMGSRQSMQAARCGTLVSRIELDSVQVWFPSASTYTPPTNPSTQI